MHSTSCGHIFIKRLAELNMPYLIAGKSHQPRERSCRRKEVIAVEVGRGYLGWCFSSLPSLWKPHEPRSECHQPQMGQERHPGAICSHHQSPAEILPGSLSPSPEASETGNVSERALPLHGKGSLQQCPSASEKLAPSKLLYGEKAGWKWKAKGHFPCFHWH